MTRGEAVNWLINVMADIGKAEHCDLWHYEQALSEIRDMLEGEPEQPEIIRCGECKYYLPKYGTCSCHQWDMSDGCQYAEVDCEVDFCSYAERRE